MKETKKVKNKEQKYKNMGQEAKEDLWKCHWRRELKEEKMQPWELWEKSTHTHTQTCIQL
jgi:hypothetical protein